MANYSLPQEIEVWYIIPAIRSELSKIFTKKYKLTFEKTGKILGISKAAVSQYINKKRAVKFKLPADVKREIEKSADKINENNKNAVNEIMRLLKLIKISGYECAVCRKFNKGIIKQCHMNPIERK